MNSLNRFELISKQSEGLWVEVWARPEVRIDEKKECETTNCTNSKYRLDRESCEPSLRIENTK